MKKRTSTALILILIATFLAIFFSIIQLFGVVNGMCFDKQARRYVNNVLVNATAQKYNESPLKPVMTEEDYMILQKTLNGHNHGMPECSHSCGENCFIGCSVYSDNSNSINLLLSCDIDETICLWSNECKMTCVVKNIDVKKQ